MERQAHRTFKKRSNSVNLGKKLFGRCATFWRPLYFGGPNSVPDSQTQTRVSSLFFNIKCYHPKGHFLWAQTLIPPNVVRWSRTLVAAKRLTHPGSFSLFCNSRVCVSVRSYVCESPPAQLVCLSALFQTLAVIFQRAKTETLTERSEGRNFWTKRLDWREASTFIN